MGESLSTELRRTGNLLASCTTDDCRTLGISPEDLAYADQESALFIAAAAEIERLHALLVRVATETEQDDCSDPGWSSLYMPDQLWGEILLEFKDGIPPSHDFPPQQQGEPQ